MKSLLRISLVLVVAFAVSGAFAVEPAGGPATIPGQSIDEFKTQSSAAEPAPPPAPQRDWLAKGRSSAPRAPEKSTGSIALNLLALVLLMGLAAAALYLKKRRPVSPTAKVASGIKILSQVRIGPKAHLVTTEVSGRVMLLGVTESSVRCLSWLDAPNDALSEQAEESEPAREDFSEGYATHAPPRPSYGPVARSATERFREVMNGVLRNQKAVEARSSEPAPNVAQLLALETKDVVQAGSVAKIAQAAAGSSTTTAATPIDSANGAKATPRRTRRKSIEALPFETQVAGLVARRDQ